MATCYTWDSSYSVGDQELDRQHQSVFDAVRAMPERLDVHEIEPMVTRVAVCASEHFAAEERHMREIGYPSYSHHREIHEGLLARLRAIAAHPRVGSDTRFSLRELLYDWFQGHILTCDMDYARFEQARRFRPENRVRGAVLQDERSRSNAMTEPLSDTEMESF